jgi:two-component system, OmpR family, phosphate regulon sensor histidine kinase PhoR
MSLAVFISAISGLIVGAGGCYIWREADLKKQLRQVLAVVENSEDREDISLPIVSQLRRKIIISQKQQQQLEQQLTSWQFLLQKAPIGYMQIDAENQILWCNKIAQDLLHIQNWQSGKARLLLELVRSYELDRSIQTARSSQVAQQLVWQFYFGYQESADAQSIWLQANSIPLTDGEIGVFIESQQAQVEATKARERWLTDLAHEVRTPLTAIRLVAETLQTKVTPDLTRWVNRMLEETNRLIDLVQHFLELSQLETSPAQYLRLEQVDIVKLIEDAWFTLEPISSHCQVEFIYTGDRQLILEIDRSRFMQVFINLFDNSLKYCPDRGHIWLDIHQVNLDRQTSQTEINIYDDGDGFALADLPYIFDRLYRGDLSRNRQSAEPISSSASATSLSIAGSGLGLAIVRQIILAHGGTIGADNHPKTGGAWIQVVLPNN